ncbi:DNA-formamidopyrimidine glycosylase family protein [Pedobacter metabolipauper]|uniref:Endonuclease-8 n=1 Tax=Pedobacter metabolipauper TaxID=425513 RepID=A0A4R6T2L1_9SPHI|nr:DNA-formamidopyrimidine glycosylase family protein [Pedobacter metabolipauper]TDQ11591.1 endonuclease-8 [Pedobacter metabolipauper]
MPEGPSLLILRKLIETLQLEGLEVIVAEGTADIDMDRIIGKKVNAIRTWGKHLLICFDQLTIKIHLMMFGTYRINERKDGDVKIRLGFKNAELNFYTCLVSLIEGDLDQVYDWSVDILSDQWDPKEILKKLKQQDSALICDVLLDQKIFSGSGNIIKNEVLYRTRVHPLSTVGSIPAPIKKAIIAEARNYGFDFFKWKRENTLSKHWEAYNKEQCPLKHPIEKIETGKNKRISFVCKQCQKLYKMESNTTIF